MGAARQPSDPCVMGMASSFVPLSAGLGLSPCPRFRQSSQRCLFSPVSCWSRTTPVCRHCFGVGFSAHWYAQSVLEHQWGLGADFATGGEAVRDGRSLLARLQGEPLLPRPMSRPESKPESAQPPRNVVLVLIEGLSAQSVEEGEVPEIRALEREGLVVRRFVTHQRQTHRGLFSVLCGAYPNLLAREAKAHLVALSGLAQRCLPAELREAGFRTAFLQAADLGYMSKDLFARAAGFDVVKGLHELPSAGTDGPWGLDDHTLFADALADLRANSKARNFLTLLTAGTHPPYRTPVSDNDKAKAFGFASASLGWFVEQLRAEGWLDDTLVLVLSDESSPTGKLTWGGQGSPIPPSNHGYLLALGAGLGALDQPGLFGQVDIAASVLDALGLPAGGFNGASIFQRQSPGRVLLAADAYAREVYVIGDAGVTRCDQALHCAGLDGTVMDPAPLRALIARNDLRRVDDSPVLATMPAHRSPADQINTLLGRYLTHLPRGQGMLVDLHADNASGAPRLFRLQAFDCTGVYTNQVQQDAMMPAGQAGYRARFRVPQLFDDQCLQLYAVPPPWGAAGDWTLQGLTLAVDVAIERDLSRVRSGRSALPAVRLEPIADAGGANEGKTYTSSIAALDHNLAAGFQWFELDFQWTADGELVCGHDWGATRLEDLGLAPGAVPTLAEFRQATTGRPDAPCTIDALRDWLATHPRARIVTDFKQRPLEGLRLLAERIPDHAERLIAQVYQPEELARARALGYRDILWTLYAFKGQTAEVLDALTRIQPLAVTMDEQRLARGLGLALERAGVPVYVHTVNDEGRVREYLAHWGASGVYTDSLAPARVRWLGVAARAGQMAAHP